MLPELHKDRVIKTIHHSRHQTILLLLLLLFFAEFDVCSYLFYVISCVKITVERILKRNEKAKIRVSVRRSVFPIDAFVCSLLDF